MPHIEATDLRRAAAGRYLALGRACQIAIGGARLFLNRRAAPPALRRACGHCPHHLRRLAGRSPLSQAPGLPSLRLRCRARMPARIVRAEERPGGARERRKSRAFPDARTMVRLERSHHWSRPCAANWWIAAGRVGIIIGTQLRQRPYFRGSIWSAIDADLGLSNGDPRAAERPSAAQPGDRRRQRAAASVSADPPARTPVMKALVACDREAFYKRDRGPRALARRSVASKPDHFRGTGGELARSSRDAIDGPSAGPAEVPLAVIKGRYRFRL
jgi:primosomal protein N' (replication factor Y)